MKDIIKRLRTVSGMNCRATKQQEEECYSCELSHVRT